MRKIVLATLVVLFSFVSQGQITKGSWLLGGRGTLTSYRNKYPAMGLTTKGSDLFLGVDAGHFVIDKLALGS